MENLSRNFYLQPTQTVARRLLGTILVRHEPSGTTTGMIIETEAYDGENDLACHARSGKTERNQAMYLPGGHAYIYFTYGMHWMFNVVTGPQNYPAAVLIRAVKPIHGLDIIRVRRSPIEEKHWCDGPAKLTTAFHITNDLYGADLCNPSSALVIKNGADISDRLVRTTSRIGIGYAPEPWRSKPWRFLLAAENAPDLPDDL